MRASFEAWSIIWGDSLPFFCLCSRLYCQTLEVTHTSLDKLTVIASSLSFSEAEILPLQFTSWCLTSPPQTRTWGLDPRYRPQQHPQLTPEKDRDWTLKTSKKRTWKGQILNPKKVASTRTCSRMDRNSSEKSTMLNWSENSGSQPSASITTKPPAPARLCSRDWKDKTRNIWKDKTRDIWGENPDKEKQRSNLYNSDRFSVNDSMNGWPR